MCWRTNCSSCGKPTFGGCGAHVEQVLGDVPPPDRCQCSNQTKVREAKRDQDVSTR